MLEFSTWLFSSLRPENSLEESRSPPALNDRNSHVKVHSEGSNITLVWRTILEALRPDGVVLVIPPVAPLTVALRPGLGLGPMS